MKREFGVFFISLLITSGLSSSLLADGREDLSDPFVSSDSGSKSNKKSNKEPSYGSNRIRSFVYDSSKVYTIRTKYGYQTNITFGKKEDIKAISVGDRSLWQIVPTGNRLFVRPMTDSISTNMTLITSKRSYEFDLKSIEKGGVGNVYAVSFIYPDENTVGYKSKVTPVVKEVYPLFDDESSELIEEVEEKDISSQEQKAEKSASFNYQYTYTGPDEIAPLQVYDDGSNTFVKYQKIKEVPSIYAIDSTGNEKSINAMVKGTSLVVPAVARELLLRGNGGEIKIYNESVK
ncbi:MAG: TrbG/VirB9 family P-type conjugative transfer protein [Rickettsiales bacterium]